MTLMELHIQKGNDGFAIFNSKDVKDLGIQPDQLISITDENFLNTIFLKAYISDDAPRDVILGDPNILECMGFDNGSLVEFEPFNGTVVNAKNVIIEFSTVDTDRSEFFKNSTQKRLIDFLSGYKFSRETEIYWPGKNTKLKVKIIDNNSQKNTVFAITPTNSPRIQLQEQIQAMPFNAILLIDKSSSMNWKDVNLQGVGPVVQALQSTLLGSSIPDATKKYPHLTRLLDTLEYGSRPANLESKGASRLDAVLLATLLFFQLKISRGLGEKCAFVLYADEAKAIPFGDSIFIEASQFNAGVCDTLVRMAKDITFLRYGNTNISSSVALCYDIAGKLRVKNKNPLMVLLLSDGGPHPPNIDNPKRLQTNMNILKQKLSAIDVPFVFYTIGIGSMDHGPVLKAAAEIGNGEFQPAMDVRTLIEWYQKLAKSFTQNIVYKPE